VVSALKASGTKPKGDAVLLQGKGELAQAVPDHVITQILVDVVHAGDPGI